jgi:zinc D-Ala-D-Ala carboxypeptidase
MGSRHTSDAAPSRREAAAGVAAGAGAALLLALGVASGGAPAGYAVPATLPSAVAAAGAEPVAAGPAVLAVGPATAVTTTGGRTAEVVDCTSVSHRPAQQGSIGGLVLGMAGLFCGPLGPAGGLPPTALEAQEPGRLYALVTRERGVVPPRYAPEDLVPLPGGLYEAREEVAAHLRALLRAAREEGHDYLAVTSGFRDHDTQAGTHEDWVRRLGAERAEEVSARPGHSEHQLGLAVDVTGECGGFDCFGDSDDGRWVAANAHRFGFIVRYPEGGKQVTGYAYEPWHLRYVGPRAAWAMHLQGEIYWEDFAPVALEAATSDR